MSIVKLIRGDPNGPGFREEEIGSNYKRAGRKQTTHPGSYGIIDDHPTLRGLRSLTIQMWILPTTPEKGEVQGLLTKWSGEQGFAFVIGAKGDLGFWLGDGIKVERVHTEKRLRNREWYFVSASFDAATHSIAMRQVPLAHIALDDFTVLVERSVQLGGPYESDFPLLIAATNLVQISSHRAAAAGLFNGKIDRPALFARALQRVEIERLEQNSRLSEIRGKDLVAAWDFSIGIPSAKITDVGRNGLSGQSDANACGYRPPLECRCLRLQSRAFAI